LVGEGEDGGGSVDAIVRGEIDVGSVSLLLGRGLLVLVLWTFCFGIQVGLREIRLWMGICWVDGFGLGFLFGYLARGWCPKACGHIWDLWVGKEGWLQYSPCYSLWMVFGQHVVGWNTV
jgi:hypothetical protein